MERLIYNASALRMLRRSIWHRRLPLALSRYSSSDAATPISIVAHAPESSTPSTPSGASPAPEFSKPEVLSPSNAAFAPEHPEHAQTLAEALADKRPKTQAYPFPIYRAVKAMRRVRNLSQGARVGFVPTMGALHEGHLSLVRRALDENDEVFVSIFVNPTQFAVHEDLDSYPSTFDEDLAKLKRLEIDYHRAFDTPRRLPKIRGIFVPTVKEMYPGLPPTSDIAGHGSFVTITPLGFQLEGKSRPIFFRGVATVCMKLFNIVQADQVYFGQKDVQQSILIKRMVQDFHIPTKVRVIPTTREPDGLAMSSRNVYLGNRRREDATVLSRALFAAQALYDSGVSQAYRIRTAAQAVFINDAQRARSDGRVGPAGHIQVDYIELCHPQTMAKIEDDELITRTEGAVLSAAMVVSPVDSPETGQELDQRSVRLIDNVILEPRVDPETKKRVRRQAAYSYKKLRLSNQNRSEARPEAVEESTSESASEKPAGDMPPRRVSDYLNRPADDRI